MKIEQKLKKIISRINLRDHKTLLTLELFHLQIQALLFVNDFSFVSEEFLEKNNHLFHQVQNLNMQQLDLEKTFFQILDTVKKEMI